MSRVGTRGYAGPSLSVRLGLLSLSPGHGVPGPARVGSQKREVPPGPSVPRLSGHYALVGLTFLLPAMCPKN